MDLFENINGKLRNLLPYDGVVNYHDIIMSSEEARHFLNSLLETIEWKNDEVISFGKRIVTKRKMAWYGDKSFNYTYSKTTKQALPWNDELLSIKKLVEQESGETFNSCLLNLYHDGSEGMGWHSDAEKELKKDGAIASLSLGAERRFSFKHKKTKETISLTLQHGSLIVMKQETQSHWLHSLPPTTKINLPRVNLTFRNIELY